MCSVIVLLSYQRNIQHWNNNLTTIFIVCLIWDEMNCCCSSHSLCLVSLQTISFHQNAMAWDIGSLTLAICRLPQPNKKQAFCWHYGLGSNANSLMEKFFNHFLYFFAFVLLLHFFFFVFFLFIVYFLAFSTFSSLSRLIHGVHCAFIQYGNMTMEKFTEN